MSNFDNVLDTLTPEQRAAVEAELTKRKPAGRSTDAVGSLNVRVSEKGAISFYGFGRFPITVYAKALLQILAEADTIRQYLVDHKDTIVWKAKAEAGEHAPEDSDILGQ